MSQLNIHMTSEFEKELAKYMRIKHLPSKAEAIRTAIKEGLAHSMRHTKNTDFGSWLGLGLKVPQKSKTKFKSDDDLWK